MGGLETFELIRSDVFDIAKRIKEIDKSYFIVFNKKERRYEVHSNLQKLNTLAFIVPYKALDYRTIVMARRTRSERIKEMLKEIEKENKKLESMQKFEVRW